MLRIKRKKLKVLCTEPWILGSLAGHLSGPEQRRCLWEGNGKYLLPLQTLLFPFLPVKPIMPPSHGRYLSRKDPRYGLITCPHSWMTCWVSHCWMRRGKKPLASSTSLPFLCCLTGLAWRLLGQLFVWDTQNCILFLFACLSESALISRQCFSNSNEHRGILLKHKFWLDSSKVEPEILPFLTSPGHCKD